MARPPWRRYWRPRARRCAPAGRDARPHTTLPSDGFSCADGGREPLVVNVVQYELGIGQLRESQHVGDQVAGELDAASADEGDRGHGPRAWLSAHSCARVLTKVAQC